MSVRASSVALLSTLIVSVGCDRAGPGDGPPGGDPAAVENTEEAKRQSQEKLKRIGQKGLQAGLGYYTRMLCQPPEIEGKPLLSWRVHMLRVLDHENLFQEFHLDEPWDSPHNLELLAKCPDVYKPVAGDAPEGYTFYRSFVGPDAMYRARWVNGTPSATDYEYRGSRLESGRVHDGNANTVWIVEARDPVPWTSPEELPFDREAPMPKFGGMFEGGFHALFCDGKVRFIPHTIDPDRLRPLVTPLGREAIDLPELGLSADPW